MGLYTRKLFEQHTEALDKASMCISAGVAGADYIGRLEPYMDDFYDMALYFWQRSPVTREKLESSGPEVTEVAKVFYSLTQGVKIVGYEMVNGVPRNRAQYYESVLERVRRKLKGKLFMTRQIVSENEKKPKCDDKENHVQPCMCRKLNLIRLAEAVLDKLNVG